MRFNTKERGDITDVFIIAVAVLFLLIVFNIDIIGWIHQLFLKIAAAIR